ncbi:MAG: hypothetical protein AMJ54_11240 [Deltaproteobacteria bacterium SG8_13]|nr:MAG: hypothetical protein AMJ54_11240 [Deltaproteobacteria bacterium SG8_13]
MDKSTIGVSMSKTIRVVKCRWVDFDGMADVLTSPFLFFFLIAGPKTGKVPQGFRNDPRIRIDTASDPSRRRRQ